MKLKHHLIRHCRQAQQAPLWQWLIIIFLVIAMPLFFSFATDTQLEQTLQSSEQTQSNDDETG